MGRLAIHYCSRRDRHPQGCVAYIIQACDLTYAIERVRLVIWGKAVACDRITIGIAGVTHVEMLS